MALALLARLEEVEAERAALLAEKQSKASRGAGSALEARLESRCAALDAVLEAAQEEIENHII